MNRSILVLLLVIISSATGCGGAASLSSWRASVERYVTDTGGGDPGVLRDVKLDDGRRGFAVLGSPNPADSTDVHAVLLRHIPVNGQPRFIYLVGVIERQSVKDIRLATLFIDDGKFDWRTSKKDSQALKQYQQFNERRWRDRFPDRKSAPPEYNSFPQSADQFDVQIGEQLIRASHRESGAAWELPIEPAKNAVSVPVR
ncbi:hypothetical protein BH09PLA1_BH09PLA1_11130 [soil metagenome]